MKRGETSGRSDDNLEIIKKRLDVFDTESMPVIEYFKQQGRLKMIDSEAEVPHIASQVSQFLE